MNPFVFLAVASFLSSVALGAQSIKAQSRASRAQERLQRLQAKREKRQSIRKAQIAQAQIAAEAATKGTGGLLSSPYSAATSDVGSQLGYNLSFLDSSLGLTTEISKQKSKANRYQGYASIAGTIFDFAGGFDTLTSPSKPSK